MFWPKPGNPREGRREGRMGGRAREGGCRAKPGNQLVYIYVYVYIFIVNYHSYDSVGEQFFVNYRICIQ